MTILPSNFHKSCQAKFSSLSVAKAERGFTLLELLAVIVIIGVIVSFAGLSIGQRSSRTAQDEAERLHGLIRMSSEEAVLQGRELTIEFTKAGYRFQQLGKDSQWIPIREDTFFRERQFPPDVQIELVLEGAATSFDDEKNLPRIFILSSGELTPFTINFKLDDKETYTLTGTIDGKLNLTPVGKGEIDA